MMIKGSLREEVTVDLCKCSCEQKWLTIRIAVSRPRLLSRLVVFWHKPIQVEWKFKSPFSILILIHHLPLFFQSTSNSSGSRRRKNLEFRLLPLFRSFSVVWNNSKSCEACRVRTRTQKGKGGKRSARLQHSTEWVIKRKENRFSRFTASTREYDFQWECWK